MKAHIGHKNANQKKRKKEKNSTRFALFIEPNNISDYYYYYNIEFKCAKSSERRSIDNITIKTARKQLDYRVIKNAYVGNTEGKKDEW